MIVRHPLESSLTAADAALRLGGEDRPFALIGAWAGGGAILGCAPLRVAGAGEDPFVLLDSPGGASAAGAAPGEGVGGGWVGYLGYELRHRVESCHPSPFDAAPPPPFVLAFYDNVARLDAEGRWWFEALPTGARAAELERRRAWWAELLADASPRAPAPAATRGWRLVPARGGHEAAVAACRERIHAGDLFQANVCARLEGELDGSALELFARGVRALAPDRAAYLEGPWGAVVSLSPELFLQRHGRRVLTAPIKGTAGERGALEASAKDRAENTMIVDLMRNDLGRVCEPGSVRVTALAQARPHTGVWHLVSEVEGVLRAEAGDGALLRATFPPGSVTGAPKVAAMDVISELESTARGAYTGAIGFASPAAGLELSVAIRTFEVAGSRIRLGVGGGVVADSEPAAEAEELAVKAAPLLRAIGTALEPLTPGRRVRAPILRAGPEPVPRPDPAGGLYDTVRVAEGRPVGLDVHLARLAASARALYGLALPGDVEARIAAAAAAGERAGRLRIDLRPGGAITLTAGPLPGQDPVALRAWTVAGGIGPHKWADRRLLEALEAASAGAAPLLVDADGAVLEASTASLVVLRADGTAVTPPADGRILPGTARARLLAAGGVAEAEIGLDELLEAESAWLASALRVRPVTAVDGRPLRVRVWPAAGGTPA